MNNLIKFIENHSEQFRVCQLFIDSQYMLIDTNSNFKTLTGYNPARFVGKELYSFLTEITTLENVKKVKREAFNALQGKEPSPLAFHIEKKSGVTIPILLSISLFKNKPLRDTRIIILLRDVTEIIRHQDSEFFKDLLAHDIGNILNNIQLSVRLLENYIVNPKKQEKKMEILKILQQQVERGTSLISKVRKLSTMNDINNIVRSIDLRKILQSAIENISSQFQEREIAIKTNIPSRKIRVKAGELLQDAFENILLNGCIHNGSEKIQLWISVSKAQINNKHFLKVEFKDNGIGVCRARRERIFQRGPQINRNSNQMSLGLWLVLNIVEEYGGLIKFKNRIKGDYTEGSNFIIYLKPA